MDSVTHVAVGAALGELVLGRKIGNRAMFWGAVAGSLPDVDVALSSWMDDVSFLSYHRGFSHSLLFALLVGSALGWLCARWSRGRSAEVGVRAWSALWLCCLLSHLSLDACTTYGTSLFLPFSGARVALNNLFGIDPLYTLPVLVGVLACLFMDRAKRPRRVVNGLGLAVSCLYLGFTFFAKYEAQEAFLASLDQQGIEATQSMTAPTPFNTVLWYCLAETKDGYWIGYYSLLDRGAPIHFTVVPRNEQLLAAVQDQGAIDRLVSFSDGYYTVQQDGKGILFSFLKFGSLNVDPEQRRYVFAYRLEPKESGDVMAKRLPRRPDGNVSELARALWERILGRNRRGS